MRGWQPQEMDEDSTPALSSASTAELEEGIKFARTVVRVPEANNFDKADLSKVASTPWDLA